jgi:hypothetical protein
VFGPPEPDGPFVPLVCDIEAANDEGVAEVGAVGVLLGEGVFAAGGTPLELAETAVAD